MFPIETASALLSPQEVSCSHTSTLSKDQQVPHAAVTAELEMGLDGHLEKVDFYTSTIKLDERVDYDSAEIVIDNIQKGRTRKLNEIQKLIGMLYVR